MVIIIEMCDVMSDHPQWMDNTVVHVCNIDMR